MMRGILTLVFFACFVLKALGQDREFLNVVETCMTGNHEASDCEILRKGADRYGLPKLAVYATMLEQKQLDTGRSCIIDVMQGLYDYALRHYGIHTMETVMCQHYVGQLYYTVDKEKSMDIVCQAEEAAASLLKNNPKKQEIKLLRIMVQLGRITEQIMRDPDNPELFCQILDVEKELEPILKDESLATNELVDICSYLVTLKSFETYYKEYLVYEYRKRFPKEQLMAPVTYSNGVTTNIEAYAKREVRMSRHLWGEHDMRRVNAEFDYLSAKTRCLSAPYDSVHQSISDLQDFITSYLPAGDPFLINVEILKRECDIAYGQNLHEIRNPRPLLFKVGAYYGEDSEEYYHCLYQLTQQLALVNPLQASRFLKETIESAERLYKDSPSFLAINLLGLFPMMQALAQEDAASYQQFITRIITLYESHQEASWQWTFAGTSLASISATALQQPDKACELFHRVLSDIRQLTGGDSRLYAYCLSSDALYHHQSTDKAVQQHGVEHCNEAIKLLHQFGQVNGELYRILSEIHFNLNEYDAAEQTLREGIIACSKKEDGMWRCFLQMALGQTIYSRQEKGMTPEVRQLFEESIPYYVDHVSENDGTFLMGYLYVGDYYRTLRQYKEAEEALRKGLELYEAQISTIDFIYMDFISELYDLYANELNDLDKAERVLEGKLETIQQSPTYYLHSVLLELLWKRYQHLSGKYGYDFMMRWAALNDIIKETNLIAAIGGNNEQIQTLAMPLAYEAANICVLISQSEKEAEIMRKIDNQEARVRYEASIKTSEAFKAAIKLQVFPILQQREQTVREQGASALEKVETYQLYQALANYYIGIERDTLKAAECYLPLLQSSNSSIRYMASSQLAFFYIAQRKYADAKALFDNMEQMEKNMTITMTNSDSRSTVYTNHALSCYYTGNYDKALELFRKNYALRKEHLARNFDLLTEAERYSLLNKGGTGSEGIHLLLPHYPKMLAAESYDVALAEKGILLRASERIRRAVLSSGDEQLMVRIDSLNQLKQAFKAMDLDNIGEQGIYQGYKQETLTLRQQIEQLERSINRQAEQYIRQKNTPDWHQLQSALQDGEAAVEYVFCDSVPAALVLLPQGEPHYVPLVDSGTLHLDIRKLLALSPQEMAEALYKEDRIHLYRRLWQPLEPLLEKVTTVYYSPTRYLNTLAFAAILCDDGRPLMDHYELHQLLSTGNLVEIRQQASRQPVKSAALMGAVYYSPEQQGEPDNAQPRQRAAITDAFDYLPFTRAEVQSAEEIMHDNNINTSVKMGMEPTEEWLRSQNGESADILHLSTHGFFINDYKQAIENPFLARFPASRFSSMQRSGMALVGANDTWEGLTSLPEEKDGILTASEVSTLDLSNTRLAVLSACQTAVGDVDREGVYGMQRGFKQAGVGSILASLWNVNDKSTARLMQVFYQKWLSGSSMQHALHEAVRVLRQEYPSPFYWAPFVLMDAEN